VRQVREQKAKNSRRGQVQVQKQVNCAWEQAKSARPTDAAALMSSQETAFESISTGAGPGKLPLNFCWAATTCCKSSVDVPYSCWQALLIRTLQSFNTCQQCLQTGVWHNFAILQHRIRVGVWVQSSCGCVGAILLWVCGCNPSTPARPGEQQTSKHMPIAPRRVTFGAHLIVGPYSDGLYLGCVEALRQLLLTANPMSILSGF